MPCPGWFHSDSRIRRGVGWRPIVGAAPLRSIIVPSGTPNAQDETPGPSASWSLAVEVAESTSRG